ncbi:MAG: F0F1 ATP synthase subunit B [Bacteroidota bacterium]
MLELNPGLIIWTGITFFLLLLILRTVAWKPILTALQTREDTIRSSLDRAEEAKRGAEHILEENRKNLSRAEQESFRIINEGKSLAEKMKSEIVEKANAQARRMIEEAREGINREKEVALSELRGEVADLAVLAASKILEETLDVRKHRKMVDNFLKELPKS